MQLQVQAPGINCDFLLVRAVDVWRSLFVRMGNVMLLTFDYGGHGSRPAPSPLLSLLHEGNDVLCQSRSHFDLQVAHFGVVGRVNTIEDILCRYKE